MSVFYFTRQFVHSRMQDTLQGNIDVCVLFTVRGKSLGFAMRQMTKEWTGFTPKIDKSDDGPAQKAIKKILSKMLQAEPKDRISITEVLERLSAVIKDFPEFGKIPSVSTPPSHTGIQLLL